MSYHVRNELQIPPPRLQHVLAIGMRTGQANVTVATRSSRAEPPRVASDFAAVAEVAMGRKRCGRFQAGGGGTTS
eukprot:1117349-Prymnesium_polylepis.1